MMKKLTREDVRNAKEEPLNFLMDRDLSGLNLSGLNLSGINLSKTNLSEVDFGSAKLDNAIFYKAVLQKTNFQNAFLRCTDLRSVNLGGANLKGANLDGAFFHNTYNILTLSVGGRVRFAHRSTAYTDSTTGIYVQFGRGERFNVEGYYLEELLNDGSLVENLSLDQHYILVDEFLLLIKGWYNSHYSYVR